MSYNLDTVYTHCTRGRHVQVHNHFGRHTCLPGTLRWSRCTLDRHHTYHPPVRRGALQETCTFPLLLSLPSLQGFTNLTNERSLRVNTCGRAGGGAISCFMAGRGRRGWRARSFGRMPDGLDVMEFGASDPLEYSQILYKE